MRSYDLGMNKASVALSNLFDLSARYLDGYEMMYQWIESRSLKYQVEHHVLSFQKIWRHGCIHHLESKKTSSEHPCRTTSMDDTKTKILSIVGLILKSLNYNPNMHTLASNPPSI